MKLITLINRSFLYIGALLILALPHVVLADANHVNHANIEEQATSEKASDTDTAISHNKSFEIPESRKDDSGKDVENTTENVKLINVEIILFQRLVQDNVENITDDKKKINIGNAIVPAPENTESEENVFVLPRNQWQLDSLYEKFEQHDAYQPILHLAWRQPLIDKSRAPNILLESSHTKLPNITSVLKIWLSNKVDINLSTLINFENTADKNQELSAYYHNQKEYIGDQPLYIVHPLIGTIISITDENGQPLTLPKHSLQQ